MASRPSSRTLYTLTLIASIAWFLFVCLYLSAHRMMWSDEFDAWHLLADPSWRHALQSWNNGADGGPPLYYFLGRCLFAVTGAHPVVMRLYSTACFWLAAVLWVQILRRYFTGILAVAAVALAFLCNIEFVDQMAQVRFYGELVLAVALAIRVALWLEDAHPSARTWFLSTLFAGLFLVMSHPLGLVYGAAIVLAQMFGRAPARQRLAALAGAVLSWTSLLIFLRALNAGAATTNWLTMPNLGAVVHFYDNHPLFFVHCRYLSVALNLALLCLSAYACIWFVRHPRSPRLQPDSLRLLLFIAAILLLTPIGFANVSHLYKPLFLSRYLLPYTLGYVTLAAAGAWLLLEPFAKRSPWLFAALLGVPLAVIAVLTFKEQVLYPVSDLEPLLQLAQSTPVVLQDDGLVMDAHFYAASRAANIFYLLLPLKPGAHATLYSVVAQGYEPELVFAGPFLQQHSRFLYVETQKQPWFFNDDLAGNPHWTHTNAGSVAIYGIPTPVLLFTRADTASPAKP